MGHEESGSWGKLGHHRLMIQGRVSFLKTDVCDRCYDDNQHSCANPIDIHGQLRSSVVISVEHIAADHQIV